MDRLFKPSWHCVCTLAELPSDGSFKTVDLFDHPLIVWRQGDEVHCFLNVCSHRSCTLTDKPCGSMAQNLKCQYHGWEYDETGNTRKIPDAKSFKPLRPGLLGLHKFHAQTAGQLVFVNLSEDPPSLEEFLGPLYAKCEEWFSPDHELIMTESSFQPHDSHEANWKIFVENVLESYHVDCVHPKTFQKFPDEQYCTDEIHDVWDWHKVDYSHEPDRGEDMLCRLMGKEPTHQWNHLIRYPNTIFVAFAFFTLVQVPIPVSPTKCKVLTRVFGYPGKRGRWLRPLLYRLIRSWAFKWFPTVNAEDAPIFAAVQRGLKSPLQPKGGLVSAREERIFPFQKYVLRETTVEKTEPPRAQAAKNTLDATAFAPLHTDTSQPMESSDDHAY